MKLTDPAKGLPEKEAKELRKKTPGWMRPKTKKAQKELREERIKTWEAMNGETFSYSAESGNS